MSDAGDGGDDGGGGGDWAWPLVRAPDGVSAAGAAWTTLRVERAVADVAAARDWLRP